MVAVMVTALMVVLVYLGISTSFSVIQRTRENLRATQVLVQRMETVRLYTWDQLLNVPASKPFQTNFSEPYDPLGGTNGSGAGVVYYGSIQVSTNPAVLAGCSYRANVALVSVSLRWTNHTSKTAFPHQRTFQTLAAKSGMQQYVYGSTQ